MTKKQSEILKIILEEVVLHKTDTPWRYAPEWAAKRISEMPIISKEDWLAAVSKISETEEDEFRAAVNSPELMWEKIIKNL